MGSRFDITAVAKNDTLAWKAIKAGISEVKRIEKLISSWDPATETSAINRNAGIHPVKVDRELYDLIFRAKKVSRLTGGAFDISYASMDRIWKFDGSMKKMPDSLEVKKAASKINWKNILLDDKDHSVFLKEKGMKIGFGAIGKGYAANRAMTVMKKLGIAGGLVNASGDLNAWGVNGISKKWKIKIADPKNVDKALGFLEIDNMAVVTSGDYEKFITMGGKRYAHIIDPRTGYPTTGIKSVTIVCPDAELADALATSVFVLGKKNGLELINKLANIECLIVTDQNELFSSKGLKINYY